MKKLLFSSTAVVLALSLAFSGCSSKKKVSSINPGRKSTATGIAYDGKKGKKGKKGAADPSGFEVNAFKGQPAGPNLVFIEGGRFTMGTVEEDVTFSRDNLERTVTVSSFYMDETEITNLHWLEYLHGIRPAPRACRRRRPRDLRRRRERTASHALSREPAHQGA